MRKTTRPETLTDALRRLIRAGVGAGSMRELAREADIAHGVLSRFLAGKRTITLETADRLAAALKVRLTTR